ncbi:MAG: hypothetical protein WA373_06570 [Burkholderiales bacterium]
MPTARVPRCSAGENALAPSQYRHALEIERSIEHEDDIAVNLVNLSIAYQRPGDDAAAKADALPQGARSRLPERRCMDIPEPFCNSSSESMDWRKKVGCIRCFLYNFAFLAHATSPKVHPNER